MNENIINFLRTMKTYLWLFHGTRHIEWARNYIRTVHEFRRWQKKHNVYIKFPVYMKLV